MCIPPQRLLSGILETYPIIVKFNNQIIFQMVLSQIDFFFFFSLKEETELNTLE